MTKQEIIDYMYENHVQGDFKIEEMAEDLAQPEIIRCKDCKHYMQTDTIHHRGWCWWWHHFTAIERYCSERALRGDSDDR